MPPTTTLRHAFEQQQIAVVVPTYNNAGTLAQVVAELLAYTHQIIVVNDGSTDETLAVLHPFMHQIQLVNLEQNGGKGLAMLAGFKHAKSLGYKYAITIDSDGQHYPKDVAQFVAYNEAHPDALIIGARNMNQSHIPGKSSFGNKFSNFWFWVETGHKMQDTQSGFRLYPLDVILGMRYFSSKYEFEIEAPVRASWKGTPIAAVPVSVYYPPTSERVSHFRPFKDFTRISVLNTFLTFIALLWIHPRDFFQKILTKQGLKDLWEKSFLKKDESNWSKAKSLSFGVFMGIIPIWGFQLLVGIPLSVIFKMNKPLFLIGANISIFPFTPFIWIFSLMAGKFVLGFKDWQYDTQHLLTLEQVKEAGLAFFLGGTVLALAASLVCLLISWGLFSYFRNATKAPTLS